MDDRQVEMAWRMMADRKAVPAEMAWAFGVSKPRTYTSILHRASAAQLFGSLRERPAAFDLQPLHLRS